MTTLTEFATELRMPVAALQELIRKAGNSHVGREDIVSDSDKAYMSDIATWKSYAEIAADLSIPFGSLQDMWETGYRRSNSIYVSRDHPSRKGRAGNRPDPDRIISHVQRWEFLEAIERPLPNLSDMTMVAAVLRKEADRIQAYARKRVEEAPEWKANMEDRAAQIEARIKSRRKAEDARTAWSRFTSAFDLFNSEARLRRACDENEASRDLDELPELRKRALAVCGEAEEAKRDADLRAETYRKDAEWLEVEARRLSNLVSAGAITLESNPARPLLLDGSNIACWGGSQPRLAIVLLLVTELHRHGLKVVVIFDANFPHRLRDSTEKHAYETLISNFGSIFVVSPGRTRADDFLLLSADNLNGRIISQDQYRDYKSRYGWIESEPDRLIKGMMVGDDLAIPILDIHVRLPGQLDDLVRVLSTQVNISDR